MLSHRSCRSEQQCSNCVWPFLAITADWVLRGRCYTGRHLLQNHQAVESADRTSLNSDKGCPDCGCELRSGSVSKHGGWRCEGFWEFAQVEVQQERWLIERAVAKEPSHIFIYFHRAVRAVPRGRKTFFGAAINPSQIACFRARLRARRTASAFSRLARSDGFS